MKKFLVLPALLIQVVIAFAQNIRPLNELINNTNSGWNIVQSLIDHAKNKIVILSADTIKAKNALYQIQITTRSPMGAIIYKTGGILVDDGWIRILGSGSKKLRSITSWNNERSIVAAVEHAPSILVADDIIGGFFAINGGSLGADVGKIYYLSPDNLNLEPLNLTYTDFLKFCFNGDLDKFYQGLRWNNWRTEVLSLSGDQCFNFYPYLWSTEGKDISKNNRTIIPVAEMFSFEMTSRKEQGNK